MLWGEKTHVLKQLLCWQLSCCCAALQIFPSRLLCLCFENVQLQKFKKCCSTFTSFVWNVLNPWTFTALVMGGVFCFSVGKVFVVVSLEFLFPLSYHIALKITKINHWCIFRCIRRGRSPLSLNFHIPGFLRSPGPPNIPPTPSSVDIFSAISGIC